MPFMQANNAVPNFTARIFHARTDSCCEHDVAGGLPLSLPVAPVMRRSKLAEVDSYIHCSIIGTCLTTAELRKLVPRYASALDRNTASDLEIHHAAVELSTRGEIAAKEINKALDARHAPAIKRFKSATDEAALALLWRDALAHGDVPGAYWALLTHPVCSFKLRDEAFGDVHMLSHLVGASNRADLRRLTALEQENARLKQQNAMQQSRLNELMAQKQQASDLAEHDKAALASLRERYAALASCDLVDELAQTRASLSSQQALLALQSVRRAELEGLLQTSEHSASALHGALADLRTEREVSRAEADALEQTLAQALQGSSAAALPQLQAQCVMYVGGRPQTTALLARLMAGVGGELLVHDGGIEDRKGLLDAMLARADVVVFPVDCISHNAMHVTKKLAARLGIECHPLRSASIASFVELMRRRMPVAVSLG